MKASDACRIAEISYRQLDYWSTKGYITPYGRVNDANPGMGVSREFSAEMVRKARLMKCLIGIGFAVQVAEQLAEHVIFEKEKSIHIGHGVTIQIEPHDH